MFLCVVLGVTGRGQPGGGSLVFTFLRGFVLGGVGAEIVAAASSSISRNIKTNPHNAHPTESHKNRKSPPKGGGFAVAFLCGVVNHPKTTQKRNG